MCRSDYADAQAGLRFCCLHERKPVFSRPGPYYYGLVVVISLLFWLLNMYV